MEREPEEGCVSPHTMGGFAIYDYYFTGEVLYFHSLPNMTGGGLMSWWNPHLVFVPFDEADGYA